MQTLISIQQRWWSGRIASLPVFLSFFIFSAKATGHTVRQIWTNEGSKRVVQRKKVPFGGLNDVPLNFGGKIPPKLKFWGVNRSPNDKKFKSL